MLFIFENLLPVSKYLHYLLLCGFIFFFTRVAAQDPHPAFKQYDVEDGLPSSKIYQVKQDSKGYMWFATDNGVSRFNGYEFEQFSVSDELPDNTIFEIFEDKKGRVWFLTLTNKLFYYEQDKMHLYKYNNVIDQIEGNHVKTSFCIAENGSVFIGLDGYGIIEITEQGKLKRHSYMGALKPAITIKEPVPDCLVYVYNCKASDSSSISIDTKFLKGFRKETFRIFYNLHPSARFVRLRNQKILFSYENALNIVDDLNQIHTEYFNERISWIYEDKDGDLWIGTYMGGVYCIKNGDFEHKKNYLKDLFVTGVIQDNQGGFWFTTEGNSVYYTPSKQILTYDQASGLKDARVTCLASDTEGIYLGLERPLVHKIMISGAIKSYESPPVNKTIVSLFYDAEKSALWFSGYRLSVFMPTDNSKPEQYTFRFLKLIKQSPDSYWIVNSDGVHQLVNKKRIYHQVPKIKRLNTILKKDDETLYLGAIDGLWEYRHTDRTWKHVLPDNPLMCNRILEIAYANNGELLLATKGAGLLTLHKDSSVSQINHTNGLSSDNVRKMIVDGPFIWLATDKGLNRLTKDDRNFWHIKSYTTRNGLISNEVYDIHKFNHKIWVATDKGLSFFDPDMPLNNHGKIPLYIQQIIVNDSARPVSSYYNLDYFENNIKIRFIALSYTNSGKLRYRYKMLGLNPQWNYTQEREIQYTTLPAGNYTFAVSVLNDDDTWSKEAFMKFTIAMPFWKTWWFFAACVMFSIIVLFFSTSYWIIRKHKEKNKEDEINQALAQLKLKALRAQMNPHFIFNVMNSIQHYVIHKNSEAAHRYLSKFSRLIRTILNNSDSNMIPLSEEIIALELYLDLEAMRFEKRFDYEIRVDESLDTQLTQIPSMLIQPYVENAVKHGILHAKHTGKIKIEVVKQGNFLKCSIEDNGVGMEVSSENKNSEYRSFGTSITKERLLIINELFNNKLIENVIHLYDDEKKASGTKVEIFIPYVFSSSNS